MKNKKYSSIGQMDKACNFIFEHKTSYWAMYIVNEKTLRTKSLINSKNCSFYRFLFIQNDIQNHKLQERKIVRRIDRGISGKINR